MIGNDFNPRVSIVIPVYNGSNYLGNAIECALNQTYENIEIIVVNDGSRDDGATEKIALSYGDRIRYFRKENGGVSSALNFGIREMKGDYFSWLSHDDAYTPEKIADAVEALRNTAAADERTIAYSWGNYMNSAGERLKSFPIHLETGRVYSGLEMVRYSLRHGTMNGCCMLIPRAVFIECGGFDEQLRYSQDTLMWYTMFFAGFSLVFDGKPNVMYRLHNAQVSRNRRDLFEHDAVCIAQRLAPKLAAAGEKDNELLYLYTRNIAKYDCPLVAETMRQYAKKSKPFNLRQNLHIEAMLYYSKVRGLLKKIYYRYFMKVTNG